jgi:mevalonate kinase
MNVEKRIQERLNKSRQIRKEKLGVIEDAIKNEQDNLKDIIDEMVAVTRQLELGLKVYEESLTDIIINLSDSIKNSQEDFYHLQNKAYVIQNDLEKLGLSDDSLREVIDYFEEKYDEADSKL